MERVVKVRSSSTDEIYEVTLRNLNGLVSLNCTCKAGIVKQKCKHRISLLEGDVTSLVSMEDVSVIQEFIDSIEVGKLNRLFYELDKIENELLILTNKKKKISKETWAKFSDGF